MAESYAYLITGEHGEAAFSDLPSDQATTVALVESAQPPLSSAEQVAEMLRLAEELAAARQEREALREHQRAKVKKKTDAPQQHEAASESDTMLRTFQPAQLGGGTLAVIPGAIITQRR